MVVALVVALNVVVLVVVLSRRWYRDRGSVVRYHSVQRALGTAVDRSRPHGGAPAEVPVPAPERTAPPVPRDGRDHPSPVPAATSDEGELRRAWGTGRGTRRSNGTGRSRSWRRGLAIGAAGIAALVLLVVGSAVSSGRSELAPVATSTTPPTTAATTTAPTTAPPPPPAAIDPVGVQDGVASYQVGPEVALVVTAQDRCWVGVTDPDGTIIDQQVLEPGDELPVAGATPLVVRLGAPTAVVVRAGDVPVQVPGEPGQPLDLRFEP